MLTEAAGSAQTTKATLYKKPFLSSTALNQARGNTEKEQHNPHSENGQATTSSLGMQVNATDLFLKYKTRSHCHNFKEYSLFNLFSTIAPLLKHFIFPN